MPQGKIVAVRTRPLGSRSMEQALAGADRILVSSVADFSATGGSIKIESYQSTVDYVGIDWGVDDKSDTIYLAATLPTDVGSNELISAYPGGERTEALVRLDGTSGEDAVWATVPSTNDLRVDLGNRDDESEENCVVEINNGRYEVQQIEAVVREIPVTLISGLPEPGKEGPTERPDSSPTPVVSAGPGAQVITWDSDAVPYNKIRLFIATSTDAPKDNTTEYSDVVNQPTFVSSRVAADSVNTIMVPSNVYYYSLQRYNAAGEADPSPWVAGSFSAIPAENLQLSVGLLLASDVFSNALKTNGIQIGNQSWDSVNGFQIPGKLSVPTNPDLPAIWSDKVRTDDLEVSGGFTLLGAKNTIFGQAIVQGGLSDPQKAPTYYRQNTSLVDSVATAVQSYDGIAWSTTNNEWAIISRSAGLSKVPSLTAAPSKTVTVTSPQPPAGTVGAPGRQKWFVGELNGRYYVLNTASGEAGGVYVTIYNSDLTLYKAAVRIKDSEGNNLLSGDRVRIYGYNNKIYIGYERYYHSNGSLWDSAMVVTEHDPTTLALTSTRLLGNYKKRSMYSLAFSTSAISGDSTVYIWACMSDTENDLEPYLQFNLDNTKIYCFNITTSAEVSGNHFAATSVHSYSNFVATWVKSGTFYIADDRNNIQKVSNDNNARSLWIKYAWKSSSLSVETKPSPAFNFIVGPRSYTYANLNPLPTGLGNATPDRFVLYLSSSENGTYDKIGESTSPYALLLPTYTANNPVISPKTTNGFTSVVSDNPGSLGSSAASAISKYNGVEYWLGKRSWYLPGSGRAYMGPMTFDENSWSIGDYNEGNLIGTARCKLGMIDHTPGSDSSLVSGSTLNAQFFYANKDGSFLIQSDDRSLEIGHSGRWSLDEKRRNNWVPPNIYRQTRIQAIPSGANTLVKFDTITNPGAYSTSSYYSPISMGNKVGDVLEIWATLAYSSTNTTGVRTLLIWISGVQVFVSRIGAYSGSLFIPSAGGLYKCTQDNETIEVYTSHSAGASQNTLPGSDDVNGGYVQMSYKQVA